MSMNQTMASGDRLTLLCQAGDQSVTRQQADTWLRQRQAAQSMSTNRQERIAS